MKNYSVRIETWDRKGKNLGWRRKYLWFVDLEQAIEEARDMYKKIFPQDKDKLLKIFDGNNLVWQYYNHETKTFPLKT